MNVARTAALFGIAFSLLALNGSPAVAGDPNPKQQAPNEAWEANVKIGDVSYTSVYVFLAHGVMLELQLKPEGGTSISPGFYKLKDGTLTIDWTKLQNNTLVKTSTEQGSIRKVADNKLAYTIRDHSDKRQIGLTIDFRRVRVSDDEYAKMLQFSDVYYKLRRQQLDRQQLLDVYEREVENYERAIKVLIGQ